MRASLSLRYLLLLLGVLGTVTVVLGLIQYQRTRNALYSQLEAAAEALLETMENVLAGAPDLLESERLQTIVLRFSRTLPAVGGVSVIDRDSRIVADTDPHRVGSVTTVEALIRVMLEDRPESFYYHHDGHKLYRSSRPLHGAYDPVRKTAVLGALVVDMNVSPIDERARRDFLEVFFYLVVTMSACGLGTFTFLRRSFVAPLLELGTAVSHIGDGNYSVRVPVRSRDELGALADAFNRMGEDLETSERALEEARQQLLRQERLAVLGELAGSVGHEIRNPLGVMKSSIYYLRMTQKLVDKKAIEHLGRIDQQIHRANRIITELLDYAREPTLELRRFALREALEEAVAEVDVPETVRVERRFQDGDSIVEADRGQIERILGNLIRNATQAMPDGGTLRLECGSLNGEAVVTVTDTGVGIAAEDLPRIFEPLFTSKTRGIGLGLPLSQRYAHLNRGRIHCESELGKGTSFRLVLSALYREREEPDGAS